MDLRSKVAERACQQEVERMKVDRFASPGRFNRKLVEKYLDGKSRNACPRTRRFWVGRGRQSPALCSPAWISQGDLGSYGSYCMPIFFRPPDSLAQRARF